MGTTSHSHAIPYGVIGLCPHIRFPLPPRATYVSVQVIETWYGPVTIDGLSLEPREVIPVSGPRPEAVRALLKSIRSTLDP